MKLFNIDGEKIYSFQWDMINSNMYLMFKDDTAVVIDPIDTSETESFLNTLYLKKIIVLPTHEHFDHINGINRLRRNFDIEVCCVRACADRICCASKNLSDKADVIIMFNQNVQMKTQYFEPFECNADIVFDECYNFMWNEKKIDIISTPGHSPGSVCIFFDGKFVFTGDTLLQYPTITRLPGGNKKIFFEQTMPFLKKQTGRDLMVFPGHGEPFGLDDRFESEF